MYDRYFVGLLAVGTCTFLLGCETQPTDTGGGSAAAVDTSHGHSHEGGHAHEHAAEGPHGGHVIVLGEEEYHAELTHDEATHTVAVYLLDAAAKESVTSEQESITLQVFKDGDFVDHALEAGGDGAFSKVDEELCDFLLHAEEFKGRLRVTIDGKEFVATVEHAAHDHEGHSHDADDHGDDGHTHGEGEHSHEDDGHAHDGEEHEH